MSALLTQLAGVPSARAQEVWDRDLTRERVSPSDFGGAGLLQTRTARFARDGHFMFGMTLSDPYDRYALTWQILPWLETTFRYTTDELRGNQGLDRGADVKFQLFDETADSPEIAVGFQDLLGTGLYDSEYIVASKRYGDLDFSLGVVWGYSVGRNGLINNPLRALSKRFKTRDVPGGQGGQLRINTFFAGQEIDLFGGVEYHTPFEGLSLKAEYDPNDYKAERGGLVNQDFPINVGLSYRPWGWLEFGLAYERGNTLMTRVALRSDLDVNEWMPKILDTAPTPAAVRPATLAARRPEIARARAGAAKAANDKMAVAAFDPDLLAAEVRQQGLHLDAMEVAGKTVELRLTVQSLALIEDKLRAVAPTLVAMAPPEVSAFRFVVETDQGQRQTFRKSRAELTDHWMVDTLFERLEARQFEVEAVDLEAAGTVLRVGVKSPRSELDYLVAARAVRDLMPVAGDTVTVIGRRGDTSEASLALDLADDSYVYTPRRFETAAVPAAEDGPTPLSNEEVQAVGAKIMSALEPQGLSGEEFHLSRRHATIVVTPNRFVQVGRNIGRAARAVATYAPVEVEEISVVLRNRGVDLTKVTLMRRHLEDAELGFGSPEEIFQAAHVERPQAAPPTNAVEVRNASLYPKFDWSIRPRLRPSIGAPEDPFLYQIWAQLSGDVELMPGLHIGASLGKDIYNNFDQIKRGTKGTLPPVRTNIKNYLQRGEDSLVRAQVDYVFSPASDWFARAAVGYFEMMFGGVSGEVLYRPQNSRWAVGLELSHVWQRDFNQRLGFRGYNTTTGHVGLYYKLPWYDLEASLQAGRYLGRDIGATFQMARRFKGGIKVGAFFTVTNASASDFGEGSFDKGFFFSVPLDMLMPYSTREGFGTLFRPLTSDGGQTVSVGPKLYGLTEEGQIDALDRDWHRFFH